MVKNYLPREIDLRRQPFKRCVSQIRPYSKTDLLKRPALINKVKPNRSLYPSVNWMPNRNKQTIALHRQLSALPLPAISSFPHPSLVHCSLLSPTSPMTRTTARSSAGGGAPCAPTRSTSWALRWLYARWEVPVQWLCTLRQGVSCAPALDSEAYSSGVGSRCTLPSP